jgi:hypothetical protein
MEINNEYSTRILFKEMSLSDVFEPDKIKRFTDKKFNILELFGGFSVGKKKCVIEDAYFFGHTRNGKFDGHGSMIYLKRYSENTEPTVSYTGEFRDSMFHGFGVYTDYKGTYTGHFVRNLQNGLGELKTIKNEIFSGEFINGKFSRGTVLNMVVMDGVYSGDLIDGTVRHGQGTLKTRTLKFKYTAFFQMYNTENSENDVDDEFRYDTLEYTGGWEMNVKCGRGAETCRLGNLKTGQYLLLFSNFTLIIYTL